MKQSLCHRGRGGQAPGRTSKQLKNRASRKTGVPLHHPKRVTSTAYRVESNRTSSEEVREQLIHTGGQGRLGWNSLPPLSLPISPHTHVSCHNWLVLRPIPKGLTPQRICCITCLAAAAAAGAETKFIWVSEGWGHPKRNRPPQSRRRLRRRAQNPPRQRAPGSKRAS